MDPDEIRAARLSLGLTQELMAPLLGYGDKMRVSEIELGRRKPSDAVVRLLVAYLEGYRPKDWPEEEQVAGRAPRRK